MSEYEAYPEYRDSGVEWIPEYPSEWQLAKVKYCARLNPTKNEVRKKPLDLEVSFLPMEAISEDGVIDASTSRLLGDVIDGYTYVGEGDVCIAKITPCFENGKGAVATGLMNKIAFATTEVIPIRPSNSTNADYLYYLLSSAPFRLVAEGAMYGAGGQKRVADTFVANYDFACPPTELQEQIANFLDHETAKIDTLIEKQQQLIKLLKEKRQAVISHAVTKGLNPDAPMKDSGVEWLGEVPAHWKTSKLKELFIESSLRATDLEAQKLPVLSVSIHNGISDTELNAAELDRKIQRSEDRSLYKEIDENFLVYNMMRAWQGGFGASTVRGLVSPAYVVCKPRTEFDTKYFELVLRTDNAVVELKRFSKGITDFRLRLYWDDFSTIQVPVPPCSEVVDILEHISLTDRKYENLQKHVVKQISVLKERRTALISAAVTGKIDVRNWQAPESTSTSSMDA